MVIAVFDPPFEKLFSKIKDAALKERVIKQFIKIRENPEVGKPMRFSRKGTREVYVSPYRLSYLYLPTKIKSCFWICIIRTSSD